MSEPNIHQQLRDDAWRIWLAGLEAVRAPRLIARSLRVDGHWLVVGTEGQFPIDLRRIQRILVVGGGKAGAGMVEGIEEVIPEKIAEDKQLHGWVNVPADCVQPTRWIHLHPARPPELNEPTAEGVYGTQQILGLLSQLTPEDLCICLLSGGGSALLPAPIPEITLADKQAVTRFLSAAGANIQELNTVRKQLSLVKGGGLLRHCQAGSLVALIISDVLGDPLDVIASGPTVPDRSTPHQALDILKKFGAEEQENLSRVLQALKKRAAGRPENLRRPENVINLVIGNNQTAVDAAAREAARLGYVTQATSSRQLEGRAEDVAQQLVYQMAEMARSTTPRCVVSGGEPVVQLAPAEIRGRGGRNQQLVLAAAAYLWEAFPPNVLILSAGTDGEDGPTDAAGAFVDALIVTEAKRLGLSPADYLRRNDAYHFFQAAGALLKTGPTHTNVCDVRVVLTRPWESRQPNRE